MSPILLNFSIDPFILQINSLSPTQEFNALSFFIDDIALQTKSTRTLHKVIHFLFTEGPLYGLSFNAAKCELHALNNGPHVTILISTSTHFSTFDDSGNLRIFFEYLGTYFFNQTQNTQMYQHLVNTINSFITSLPTLPLTHSEIIEITNIQLIPTLTYGLIYNSPPQDKLDKLESCILTHNSELGKLSYCTPNKTKYPSNASFGLNFTTNLQTINHIPRYSFRHGPKITNDTVINTLLTDSCRPTLLQHMTALSAIYLSYCKHPQPSPFTHPSRNSFHLLPIYHRPPTKSLTQNTQHPRRTTILHLGTLDHPNRHNTTATFPDMTVQITNNTTKNPSSYPSLPNLQILQALLPFLMLSAILILLQSFLQFTLVHNIPPAKLDHLHFLGCHDLRQALITYPGATVCYTEGCDDPKCDRPSGSAATVNTAPPKTTTNTSPIKGSYPADHSHYNLPNSPYLTPTYNICYRELECRQHSTIYPTDEM